jgi:glutaredoxin
MVTVYGADWCEDTQRSLRHLRRLGVAYDYVNVDRDPDALERAKAMNAGRRRTPTIDVDGVTLVEPSTRQLTEALEQRHQVQHAQVERRLRFNNVGDLERVLRVAGGTAALLVAARLKGAWKWPLAAWGAFEVASGGLGSCPVYTARGVTSLAGPGDHPREAERRSWLAPAG